jgi:hypothetical protein
VVVHVPHRRREVCLQAFPAAGLIRAIDKNRRSTRSRKQGLVRTHEPRLRPEKLQAPRYNIRIHAYNIVAERRQNAGERHLGTDAIAIRTRVAHHRDRTAG